MKKAKIYIFVAVVLEQIQAMVADIMEEELHMKLQEELEEQVEDVLISHGKIIEEH